RDLSLHPIEMFAKMDQGFEDHATVWELRWSNLSYPYHRGFDPIVDSSYRVVGHLGTVTGGGAAGVFITSKGSFNGDLQATLDNGDLVFFDSKGNVPSDQEAISYFTSEHNIQIKTGLDGEVVGIRVFKNDSADLEQPWYSPEDFIDI